MSIKVIVENAALLTETVMQHGGGETSPYMLRDAETQPDFVCRVRCKDGTIIDFYAKDAESVAKFPPEIRGSAERILKKYIREFVTKVMDPDPFVAIIKGHIHIEALLTALIEGVFLEPSELEIDHMTFSRKVKLCTAAGLIHKDVAHVLNEFAKIRNGFAHQLWPTFSDKELRDFLNSLRQSNRLRKRLAERKQKKARVFDCVWVLWGYLFEQACRITTERELLSEFWKGTVDIDDLAVRPIVPFPAMPLGEDE